MSVIRPILSAVLFCVLSARIGLADGVESFGGYKWSYWAENYIPVSGGVAIGKLVGITPDPSGSVQIPSKLGGYPVAVLDHMAFSGYDKMTAVTIPATVTEIGQEAFLGCSRLKNVTFLGDCPKGPNGETWHNQDEDWVFIDTPDDLTIYIYSDARGWPAGNNWFGKKLARRTRTATVVENFVTVAVAQECEGLGSVSGGNKLCRPGTKITVRATPKKGCAFVGWFVDGELVSESVSFSYTMPAQDIVLLAEFVSADTDCLYLSLCESDVDVELNQAINCQLTEFVEVASFSVWSITISGLPSGVTYNRKNSCISGAPRKKGVYYVTYSAKNANGYSHSCIQRWIVGAGEDGDYDNIGIVDMLEDLDWLNTGERFSKSYGDLFASVAGLPKGLKFVKGASGDGEVGVISGVPTKSGKYVLTFTAEDRRKTVKTIHVQDSGCCYLNVAASGEGGSVTGGGVYPFGSTVRISAKAKSGHVFAGWYCESAPFDGGSSGDYRTANESFLYTTDLANAEIVARFVDKQNDAVLCIYGDSEWKINPSVCAVYEFEVASESKPTITAKGLPSDIKLSGSSLKIADAAKLKPGQYAVTIMARNLSGVSASHKVTVKVPNLVSDKIESVCDQYIFMVGSSFVAESSDLASIRAVDGWSLSASGIPPGFKWDAQKKCFSGVQKPSKAGSYTVTFTARNGRLVSVATATFIVNPIPTRLTGTFTGYIVDNGDDPWLLKSYGTVELTVATSGKLSAKVVKGGETINFSANGWDVCNSEYAEVLLTKRSGKVTYWLSMRVDCDGEWYDWKLSGTISGGVDPPECGLWLLSVCGQRSPFLKSGVQYENDYAHAVATTLSARKNMKMSVAEMTWGIGTGRMYGLYGPTKNPAASSYPVSVVVKENGVVNLSGKIDGVSLTATSVLRFGVVGDSVLDDPYAVFYVYVKSQGKAMRVQVNFPLDDTGGHNGQAWFDF